MIRLPFVFLFINMFIHAQSPDWEQDFVYEKSSSDTIYLAEDESQEGLYLVFHSKDELNKYFVGINSGKTGEITNEYQFSIEETPARYIAKDELVEKSYRNFCKSENKKLPDFFSVGDLENSDETEKQKFLDYLTGIWKVPVNFQEQQWRIPFSIQLIITETDWRKKEFLNKINGLLNKAFQAEPPLNFTFEGIEYESQKTVLWENLHHIEINRKTNELIMKTRSGEKMKFPYMESQYSDLADFHVNFLAFYKIMLDN